MGVVVDLNKYRECDKMEKDYLEFLTYINKYLHTPTTVPEIVKNFYFTLRYLDGTVNAFEIMSVLQQVPDEKIGEIKQQVVGWLQSIINDLEKY